MKYRKTKMTLCGYATNLQSGEDQAPASEGGRYKCRATRLRPMAGNGGVAARALPCPKAIL
jgi:hypothetical protein